MELELGADVRLGGAWSGRQRLKNALVFGLVRALIAVASVAPRALVSWACSAAGAAAWALAPGIRARVGDNLAAGLGRPAAPREVRAAFARAGEVLADMAALFRPRARAADGLAMDAGSMAVFAEALAEGRGVVYATAHLGPWERMAALLVERGFPVATVARASYDPRLTEAVYERLRAPRGVRSIYRGTPGAAFRVVRELAEKRAVGFLVDLPSRGVPGVPAVLFGCAASVPLGPVRLALVRGAAVVVGTAEGGRVEVTRVRTADLDASAAGERELAARIAAAVDARIRREPAAWLGLFAAPRRGALNTPTNPR